MALGCYKQFQFAQNAQRLDAFHRNALVKAVKVGILSF